MHNVGRAVLTFSCKPYLYRKDGAMAEKYTQSGFVLTNPEEYRSVPDITIYGTGNIYLNIGYNQYYMEDIRICSPTLKPLKPGLEITASCDCPSAVVY